MSDYRHATDRIETRLIAECPAGCDVSLLVESEGQEDAVEDLVATVNEVYSECPDCGGEMGVVREIEPTEELE